MLSAERSIPDNQSARSASTVKPANLSGQATKQLRAGKGVAGTTPARFVGALDIGRSLH
jgi:hypothetical protein